MAYDMALRLDEYLFKEKLANERKDVSKKEEEKRKAAVDKAKKTRPSQSTAPPKGAVMASGLDDILRDTINTART